MCAPQRYFCWDFSAEYLPTSTGEFTRPKKITIPPPNNTVEVTRNAN